MAKGNKLTIAVMFGMVFMVGFVTMFTGPLAAVMKAQFGASNALSQFGSSANFLAYLFMGLPCGMVLKRRGYRFTSLAAVSVGILGVALQILAGFVASFGVYVAGAFVAGLSMCMLNVTANPLLNTLGGGGNGGNRLVQYGCTFNSVGGMSSPLILGFLIGNEVAKANVLDALPVQIAALVFFLFGFFVIVRADIPEPHLEPNAPSPWRDVLAAFKYRRFALGALAMFLFEPVECGICNMVNLYLTAEGTPAYAGAVVGGAMVSAYCALMMVARFGAGILGNRVSPRAMISSAAIYCIVLLVAAANVPFAKVAIPFTSTAVPVSAILMTLCGLGISVMFGGIFNLATEGLGRLVPVASGITMSLVSGGALLAVVGVVTDRFGLLSSCYVFTGLLAYILYYAAIGSRAKPV
ncbi:MAG: MFS transporter [Kiritimatiellae bacterium]|nr:MFS transporter [Kiritimatiellia bacterium]